MGNKRIRSFMDRYPEFMLALTILAILSIVLSSTVSPHSNNSIKVQKTTATVTEAKAITAVTDNNSKAYKIT